MCSVLPRFQRRILCNTGVSLSVMPLSAGTARILFVGNSLTYWSGGLDSIFRNWGFDAFAETIPGATLARHWRSGQAKAKLLEGWDIVVLQDDLPEYKTPPVAPSKEQERWHVLCAQFVPVVSKFLDVSKAAGAVPILFMAHPYERLADTTLRDICWAHKYAEASLGIRVAPGGLTHSLAASCQELEEYEVTMLDEDLEHPSEEGLYLHALAIAAACFGEERVRDLQWAPASLPDSCVDIFKQLACSSLEAWHAYPEPPHSDTVTSLPTVAVPLAKADDTDAIIT